MVKKWTEHEVEVLKFHWKIGRSRNTIARMLKRTTYSVDSKLNELKIWHVNKQRWSHGELETLKAMYATTPTKHLSTMFHRSNYCVTNKANDLGLKRVNRRRWTKDEIKRLKHDYRAATNSEIAIGLHRTTTQVSWKASQLRFTKR